MSNLESSRPPEPAYAPSPEKTKEATSFFLWAKTGTPEQAAAASKQAGFTFGLICMGYGIGLAFAIFSGKEIFGGEASQITVFINTLAAFAAGYLAWRASEKPRLWMSCLALGWAVIETVGKFLLAEGGNGGMFVLNAFAILAAINAIRGNLAINRFERSGVEPAA
jgi:hypothetical protein